ncbi:MAG TPA: RDD family protein [Candidatus Acidoferrales bacterium]|nr:RDD family protein [Candidatus Acidoferrales bacterium]
MTQEMAAPPAAACSQCRRTFAQSDLVQIAGSWVCGECKSAFLSRVVAGDASAISTWHYGGFWIRFVARIVDAILLISVQASIALVMLGAFGAQFMPTVMRSQPAGRRLTFQLLSYAIGFLYEVLFLRYRGATPGKMALGLKVIRSDGESLGWGVSIGRYFMYLVSGLILLIGYIMAGFDGEKRALHDRVCDTRVIYKRGEA